MCFAVALVIIARHKPCLLSHIPSFIPCYIATPLVIMYQYTCRSVFA